MSRLRHRLRRLEAGRLCPVHPTQALICSACDVRPLPAEEWGELAHLLEQAGYLAREPYHYWGICWRCGGEDTLACLRCLEARGEPPELARMEAAARDRLHALAAKLIPPWLSEEGPG
jgi:hypothetical protein